MAANLRLAEIHITCLGDYWFRVFEAEKSAVKFVPCEVTRNSFIKSYDPRINTKLHGRSCSRCCLISNAVMFRITDAT